MTGDHRAPRPLLDAIREIGVIRPGDRLLLSTAERITNGQAARIKARVEELLSDVTVVVVSGFTATVERASHNDRSEPMTDEEWQPFADALGIDPLSPNDGLRS